MPGLLAVAAAPGSLKCVQAVDWRTQYRAYSQPEPDPRVRLVLFDDDTCVNLDTWPPSRHYHGALVEVLATGFCASRRSC